MLKNLFSRRDVIALALCVVAFVAVPHVSHSETNAFGKKLLAAIPPHGEKSLGDPSAPVTMIEYASATCPHCAEFHKDVWPEIKRDYVDTGKVYFIFRELPTDDLALGAFMLMRCVADDKYFAAIEAMYERQETWMKSKPKEELFKLVAEHGLDATAAETCIADEKLAQNIVATRKRAVKEFGVKGTPSFFINGFFADAHKEPKQVRALIDRMLAAE